MYSVIPYQSYYAKQISQIFHDAIHNIDEEQYSEADRLAWSAKPRSATHWDKRLTRSKCWLVVDTRVVMDERPMCCGFINVETGYYSRGYIDSLYIDPRYQGNGLAKSLYEVMEQWTRKQGYCELTLDASHQSKSLFLSYGFRVNHRSYQQKLGQVIMGFLMTKALNEEST